MAPLCITYASMYTVVTANGVVRQIIGTWPRELGAEICGSRGFLITRSWTKRAASSLPSMTRRGITKKMID